VAQPEFRFDADVQEEAQALLGRSVAPLNFLHVASMLGEEEIAMELVEYMYRHTGTEKRLLLLEFLGKVWGDANTCLHLASFQGQHNLVKLLLDYGANPNKKNSRGYKVKFIWNHFYCGSNSSAKFIHSP
jgi:hypothetical protein